jgi:anti-sigma B factor antagonist
MKLEFSTLNDDIRLIKLIGKLDIIGKGEIETLFTAHCSGRDVHVIVDFSEVDFLASIGIQLLFTNAKSLSSRAGKMVFLNPTPRVNEIMELAGIPAVIPICFDLADAASIFKAAS